MLRDVLTQTPEADVEKKQEDRARLTRKGLEELGERVKPLKGDVLGGFLEQDGKSLNPTTGDCAGAPGSC